MISNAEYQRVCKELADLRTALGVPEGVSAVAWAKALRTLKVKSTKQRGKVQALALALAKELKE